MDILEKCYDKAFSNTHSNKLHTRYAHNYTTSNIFAESYYF